MINRAAIIDKNLTTFCQNLAKSGSDRSPGHGESSLTGAELRELAESQFVSRHLDLIARELRAKDKGYYTIGSSGHEGNAVIGRVTRFNDPAFLHYRSGALIAERARQVPGQDVIRDTLLGMMASNQDQIAGGRHQARGSVPLS